MLEPKLLSHEGSKYIEYATRDYYNGGEYIPQNDEAIARTQNCQIPSIIDYIEQLIGELNIWDIKDRNLGNIIQILLRHQEGIKGLLKSKLASGDISGKIPKEEILTDIDMYNIIELLHCYILYFTDHSYTMGGVSGKLTSEDIVTCLTILEFTFLHERKEKYKNKLDKKQTEENKITLESLSKLNRVPGGPRNVSNGIVPDLRVSQQVVDILSTGRTDIPKRDDLIQGPMYDYKNTSGHNKKMRQLMEFIKHGENSVNYLQGIADGKNGSFSREEAQELLDLKEGGKSLFTEFLKYLNTKFNKISFFLESGMSFVEVMKLFEIKDIEDKLSSSGFIRFIFKSVGFDATIKILENIKSEKIPLLGRILGKSNFFQALIDENYRKKTLELIEKLEPGELEDVAKEKGELDKFLQILDGNSVDDIIKHLRLGPPEPDDPTDRVERERESIYTLWTPSKLLARKLKSFCSEGRSFIEELRTLEDERLRNEIIGIFMLDLGTLTTTIGITDLKEDQRVRGYGMKLIHDSEIDVENAYKNIEFSIGFFMKKIREDYGDDMKQLVESMDQISTNDGEGCDNNKIADVLESIVRGLETHGFRIFKK